MKANADNGIAGAELYLCEYELNVDHRNNMQSARQRPGGRWDLVYTTTFQRLALPSLKPSRGLGFRVILRHMTSRRAFRRARNRNLGAIIPLRCRRACCRIWNVFNPNESIPFAFGSCIGRTGNWSKCLRDGLSHAELVFL